ncbi:ASCH domain-containing protein [Peribacillus kribbensis]|uniref:ASCH domain-containing protein n=1 Tax=Peribacillus kribbensis TaxID=356658 RepID=UPI00047A1076|nr:ASCH domain-containing protein [Peribacillus kribbensis]
MNEASQQYWNTYWQEQGKPQPEKVTAWSFGGEPDQLLELVVKGIKTATCSGYLFYKRENEPLPAIGDYSIVLSSEEVPSAIIRTTEVTILPMNEVPEDFAVAEGEGDRTYAYWKRVHEEFFTKELKPLGLEFKEDMLLVCERFELVDARE